MTTTPTSDKGIVAGQGNNPQKDSSNNADFTASANQIANQIAKMALAGHTVIRGDRGDYTVCKFGLTRYCKDIAELEAFARKVGAV